MDTCDDEYEDTSQKEQTKKSIKKKKKKKTNRQNTHTQLYAQEKFYKKTKPSKNEWPKSDKWWKWRRNAIQNRTMRK